MLSRFPLIDGHNDLPWEIREACDSDLAKASIETRLPRFHTDIPRLVEGGVGGQWWSVYVPGTLTGDEAVRVTLEQVDIVHRMIARYPQSFQLALTADDVEQAFATGRVASMLGAEGGHSIGGSLAVLRSLHALGVGLNDFGRTVVREMQRLGMLVDLSHVAVTTMHDALDVAEAPVIFSHSSAKAITDSPRNVPDEVLRRLAGNGGVCMTTFVPAFISQESADWLVGLKNEAERRGIDPKNLAGVYGLAPEYAAAVPPPLATLSQVADHVQHVAEVAGLEHVGIGGDFDGTPDLPVGLQDVSRYPALFNELVRRGWSEANCKALAGGNILRVMRAAEAYAE